MEKIFLKALDIIVSDFFFFLTREQDKWNLRHMRLKIICFMHEN